MGKKEEVEIQEKMTVKMQRKREEARAKGLERE